MSYGGFQTVNVMRSMVKLFKDEWSEEAFGKRPAINVVYDRTLKGNVGAAKQETILLYVDSEKSKPFDIGGAFNEINWRSFLSCSIDIQTNISEERISKIVDAVHAIIRKNLFIGMEDGKPIYRKLELGVTKSLSAERRGSYRYVVDLTIETVAKNKRTFTV